MKCKSELLGGLGGAVSTPVRPAVSAGDAPGLRPVMLYADGGSRGNPGPAALGAKLVDQDGNVLREISRYIGITTNNVAEWSALIAGLEAALELGVRDLAVRLDSELVVRQLNGTYRVKHPNLQPLYARAKGLLQRFERVEIAHVRRDENADADALVNRALDEHARSA